MQNSKAQAAERRSCAAAAQVNALAFSPDGSILAAGGEDDTIRHARAAPEQPPSQPAPGAAPIPTAAPRPLRRVRRGAGAAGSSTSRRRDSR